MRLLLVSTLAVFTVIALSAQQPGGGGGRGGRGGGGGGFGAPEPPPAANLGNIGVLMVNATMPMQASEMPPTAAQLRACEQQQAAYTSLMAKWAAIKTMKAPAKPAEVAK